MKVPFSYLDRQFADIDDYLDDVRGVVRRGDFTLGAAVAEFERQFAALSQRRFAITVGTGTDALFLAMKSLGIGEGDEVITTPMTFIATVGAIIQAGARPVFVDSDDGFVIDVTKIEAAITENTKAILPVHYTGNVVDMEAVQRIAESRGLSVVADACQAIGATLNGRPAATYGDTASYSLHPLKNLNVWGDGGVIVTDREDLDRQLRLLRNHGLENRDAVYTFGYNSRLDTIQAVIGIRLMQKLEQITARRREIADRYDDALGDLDPHVCIPPRRAGVEHVFHLYILRAQRRDELLQFLVERGVEAKVHYPLPVHLQPAAQSLGYGAGDFPVCEADCNAILTLPAHQHLTDDEVNFTIESVRAFCER